MPVGAGVATRPVVACKKDPLGAGDTGSETNSTRIVRTMFILYTLLIAGGIVFFVTVGLTQQ